MWVKIWWCCGGFVGFFWIWVLLLRWWLWLAEDDDDWMGTEDDDETASGELCFIFFSLSLALVFFLDQFLFREGEREGLICGEA